MTAELVFRKTESYKTRRGNTTYYVDVFEAKPDSGMLALCRYQDKYTDEVEWYATWSPPEENE